MNGTMRRAMMIPMVLVAATLGASRVGAQGAAGSWAAEIARGIRNEDGNITSEGKTAMRLELKVDGDQLSGTWGPADAQAAGGAPRRAVKGTVKGNAVSFTTEAQQARIRINDEESIIQLIPTFVLTLEGDSLKGTYQLVPADGHEGLPAMPFTATRVKS